MLIFDRVVGQKIRIDNGIEISVEEIRDRQVRIGIAAPKTVPVHREEVYLRIQDERLPTAGRAPRPVPVTYVRTRRKPATEATADTSTR